MITPTSDAPGAPRAIGPYSQAVAAGDFVFLSGQVPLHPEKGEIVGPAIEQQTEQVLKNLAAVLKHYNLDFSKVVSARIYLTDLKNFATVNSIYEKALGNSRPARATIQVSALPKAALVEIEMVAYRGK
ncbi:MAG: Rid family detoxifying hydrolase [Oligoflexia bacterium]|nr:Rid family detoxifying hydrolase [Oligoflexia bacterium]